ncbi:MAG: hypothetical protein COA62_15575 [Rhodobiaceae bacterium]|nr:MAG: hypothetical protein COA62_15575 [Rhodobiaceae bacterium]
MKSKIVAMVAALFMTACAADSTVIGRAVFLDHNVPKELFYCSDFPPNPLANGGTQKNVADWAPQAMESHYDCKSKLEAVGVILGEGGVE